MPKALVGADGACPLSSRSDSPFLADRAEGSVSDNESGTAGTANRICSRLSKAVPLGDGFLFSQGVKRAFGRRNLTMMDATKYSIG